MDLDGFEPMTSSMPWKRAPNCATGPSLLFYVMRIPHQSYQDAKQWLGKKMLQFATLPIDSIANQRHNQTVGNTLLDIFPCSVKKES